MVFSMFISMILLVLIFVSTAKTIQTQEKVSQQAWQNLPNL